MSAVYAKTKLEEDDPRHGTHTDVDRATQAITGPTADAIAAMKKNWLPPLPPVLPRKPLEQLADYDHDPIIEAVIMASRLAPNLLTAKALLAGDKLPEDVLDPDWVQFYSERGLI